MNAMTIIDIVADIVAASLVITQFITALKPIWSKLPKWLAVLMPVLVVCLPQLADAASLVKTGQGLIQFGITAVVVLVPAIVAAETNKTAAPVTAASIPPVSGSSG